MKKVILIGLMMSSLGMYCMSTSTRAGTQLLWSDSTSWTNGVPQYGDKITISGSTSMIYDVSDANQIDIDTLIIQNGGKLTIKTGCDWYYQTGYLEIQPNAELVLESETEVYLQGAHMKVSSGGRITFEDLDAYFYFDDDGNAVTLDADFSFDKGAFFLVAQGNSSNLTIPATAHIQANSSGALFISGMDGSIELLGSITIEKDAQIISDHSGNMNMDINGAGALNFKYGSSYFKASGSNKIQYTNLFPNWQIELSNVSGGAWRHFCTPFLTHTTLAELVGTDFNPTFTDGKENVFNWISEEDAPGSGISVGWEKTIPSTTLTVIDLPIAIFTGFGDYAFNHGGLVDFENKDVDYAPLYYHPLLTNQDPNGDYSLMDLGWHFIGNPYPSYLDLEQVLDDNFNRGEIAYGGAHIYDPQSGQYKVVLLSGENIITSSNLLTGGNTANGIVYPFQGFWVRNVDEIGNIGAGNFMIEEQHCTYTPSSTSYLKKNRNRIRLNTYSATDSTWDQVLIAFDNNSSKQFKGAEDGFDFQGDEDKPNLSILHSNIYASIDLRPSSWLDTVALSFSSQQHGENFYLDVNLSEFDEAGSLFLKDLKTGILHDLKSGAYAFKHDQNYSKRRFKLFISDDEISSEYLSGDGSLHVWQHNGILKIQMNENLTEGQSIVHVYDLSGRVLYSATIDNTHTDISHSLPIHREGLSIISVKHPKQDVKVLKAYLK